MPQGSRWQKRKSYSWMFPVIQNAHQTLLPQITISFQCFDNFLIGKLFKSQHDVEFRLSSSTTLQQRNVQVTTQMAEGRRL